MITFEEIQRIDKGSQIPEGPPQCQCEKCFFESVMEMIRQQLEPEMTVVVTVTDEKKGS
jgi:hypothetical protein